MSNHTWFCNWKHSCIEEVWVAFYEWEGVETRLARAKRLCTLVLE